MKALYLAIVPVLPAIVWGLKAYWAKLRVQQMRERRKENR